MWDKTFFSGAQKIWHMGEWLDWEESLIHAMSHAFHYGTAVFEGIRAYETERGPAVFRLKEHLKRLFHSAGVLQMEVPYTREELFEAVLETLRQNRLRSAYIRPIIYYSYGNLGLVPHACPVQVTIAAWAWGAYLGKEALEKGVHVLVVPWRRIHPSQFDMRAKMSGVYVQSMIAGKFARRHGFGEAVFLNLEERLAEGSGENIFIVKSGVLKTNSVEESILPGITRDTILKLAADQGIPTRVGPITLDEFLGADEAFFSGTAAEVTPITRVTDGHDPHRAREGWPTTVIGNGKPGPITRQLADLYGRVVRGEEKAYHSWLSWAYQTVEEAQAELAESRHVLSDEF
ncbi:MAG: branched-chain amino acid transaminase [Calditrichaeota bacterium]|nr:MAG: branched-chain amino acid transaminase [Calditrichota bacterium]